MRFRTLPVAAGILLLTVAGVGAVSSTGAAGAATGFGFGTVTGGSNRPVAHITAVQVGRHANFDRFVIRFDGTKVPRFKVVPKSSSTFWLDPSNRRVTLLGHAGLKIVLPSATGQGTYHGARDIRPAFPQLREARLIGDFEAVTTWGLGLRTGTAKRVLTLTAPPRLVIDVKH
jgi:hypothetical protein